MYTRNYSSEAENVFKQKEYQELKSNVERVGYVLENITPKAELKKEVFQMADNYRGIAAKSIERSQQLRHSGLQYFKEKDYRKAIPHFSEAIINAPHPTQSDQSSELYLNYYARCLASFEFGLFDTALFDANRCLEMFPTVGMHLQKVYCLKALQKFEEAKRVITYVLKDENLCRDAEENDILRQFSELNQQIGDHLIEKNKVNDKVSENGDRLDSDLWFHQNCSFTENTNRGRHMVAKESIPSNTVVLRERAQNTILLKENLLTFCYYCFKELGLHSWPCSQCVEVVFCDKHCAEKAMNQFHRFDCGIIGLVYEWGRSWVQSLRIMLEIGISEAMKTYNSQKGMKWDLNDWIEKRKLRSIGGEDKPMSVKMEEFIGMISFLDHNEEHALESTTISIFLGLQFAILMEYCNAFITENTETLIQLVEYVISQTRKVTTNVFGWIRYDNNVRQHLGNSMCVMATMCNHSCDPNIHWTVHKGFIEFKTQKSIAKGEELCITYGPTIQAPFESRQTRLKKCYFFDCSCSACVKELVKFQFTLQCKQCEGPVICPKNCTEASCGDCGHKYENVLQVLDEIDFKVMTFGRMFRNVENQIETENSLKRAEKAFEVMSKLLHKKSLQSIYLSKDISRLYSIVGQTDRVVAFADNYLMPIESVVVDKNRALDDLVFITNNYHLFLKDGEVMEKKEFEKCFLLFDRLLEGLTAMPKEFHSQMVGHERRAKFQLRELREIYSEIFD